MTRLRLASSIALRTLLATLSLALLVLAICLVVVILRTGAESHDAAGLACITAIFLGGFRRPGARRCGWPQVGPVAAGQGTHAEAAAAAD